MRFNHDTYELYLKSLWMVFVVIIIGACMWIDFFHNRWRRRFKDTRNFSMKIKQQLKEERKLEIRFIMFWSTRCRYLYTCTIIMNVKT